MAQKKINSAGLSVDEKRALIDPKHSRLSLRKQCDLISLSRSSFYKQSKCVMSQENLDIMKRIDEIYTDFPYYGSRKIRVLLNEEGYKINRKRVQRLMRFMGLEAIGPKPNTSSRHPENKIYPYLLRNVRIDRVNQVWSTDITYLSTGKGFCYLTAVIDWHSRAVLSWRVSNSMDADFCVEALKEAIDNFGCPEIFNTDQGSQFTSNDFIKVLKDNKVKISMDGKGRALDNIFVERLWRAVKYEEIYPKQHETIREIRLGLQNYFKHYNEERPHQSLEYKRPMAVYRDGIKYALAA